MHKDSIRAHHCSTRAHHCTHAHMHTCFGDRKSTKNPSKIDPKSDQKEDAILNATWKALGPIFDGFWLQNGGVGGVLGPKIDENCFQERSKM